MGLKLFHSLNIKTKDNNFYLARLLLAFSVIFGHAFALSEYEVHEHARVLGDFYALLGVNGFFVVSGYLVTASLLTHKSLVDYTLARFLRIVPGLWVMLFVTVPLVLLLGVPDFPPNSETLATAAIYIVKNMAIMPVEYRIAGIFDTMPVSAINGSIWSLRFEVLCYIALAILAATRILQLRSLILLLTIILIIASMTVASQMSDGFFLYRIVRTHSLFFFGCSVALYSNKIKTSLPLAIMLVAAAWALADVVQSYQPVFLAVGYLIFSLAYSPSRIFRQISEIVSLKQFGSPDLSYGIFLYSFPIQQLLYFNHVTVSPYWNIIATLILSGICAYFSSTYVEKPALRLRHRLGVNRGG